MKPNVLTLAVLLFVCSHPLMAEKRELSSTVQQGPETGSTVEDTPKETGSTETKVISIDVLAAPADGHAMVADPITLSLANDTLDLTIRSSVYPNEYPGEMFGGLMTPTALLEHKSKASNSEDTTISSVLTHSPEEHRGEVIEIWKPVALGSVTLEFYGDVVIKPGSLLGKPEKVRHVTVQVPVTVVE